MLRAVVYYGLRVVHTAVKNNVFEALQTSSTAPVKSDEGGAGVAAIGQHRSPAAEMFEKDSAVS